MNYSKQCELVLNTLKENVVHPSADYIYNILKQDYPNISLATVYRNLNKLAQNGIIKKIEGLEDCDHFDHNTFEHYHLICVKCGRIFDIPADIAPDICKTAKEKYSFKIIRHEIVFKGICPQCNSKGEN